MEKAFAGRAGSAVALDPRNGEILAMTSTPGYDPNLLHDRHRAGAVGEPRDATRTPRCINRVIQGSYSPGSTFKIISATAALEEGVITPATTFFCPGQLAIYGTVFHCQSGGTARSAFATRSRSSCNVYFYQVGIRLEIQRIAN